MDADTYAALPVGAELITHSPCPSCGQRDVVNLKIILVRDKGAAVSGTSAIPMRKGAEFWCPVCGQTGLAEPK